MTDAYNDYLVVRNRLRMIRDLPDWSPVLDREDLALLEDLYKDLTSAERRAVDLEVWRGWPDLYRERLAKASNSCLNKKP